ncbi:hypothetical protein ACFQ51_04575 [Streptomyces kaempferi]
MRRDAALSAVDHSSLADAAGPEVLFLLRSAENLGATVEILDLTAAAAVCCPSPWPASPIRRPARCAGRPAAACGTATPYGRHCATCSARSSCATPPTDPTPVTRCGPTSTPPPSSPRLPYRFRRPAPPGPPCSTASPPPSRDAFAVELPTPDLAAGHVHAVRVLLTRGEHCAD